MDTSDEESSSIPPVPGTPTNRSGAVVPETPAHAGIQGSSRSSQPATPPTPLTPIAAAGNRQDEEEEPVDDEGATDDPSVGHHSPASSHDGGQEGEGNLQGINEETHILGTNVNVQVAAASFTEFLRNFISIEASRKTQHAIDPDADEDDYSIMSTDSDAPPLYASILQSFLDREESASLEIDTMHLFYHNEECQKLYFHLVNYPLEIVSLMDILVKRELERMAGPNEDAIIPSVQVRPFNLRSTSNLRDLDPAAMDTLVSCRGMIVRGSPIIPDLKVAHFVCSVCGSTETSVVERGKVTEPSGKCGDCGTRDSYYIVHNRCIFANKQMVRLQETPDEVPAGQTPASVVTFCYDDLVDSVQPGDKVEVTGVLRAQPVRVHPRIRKVKAVYRTYLDVIHFRPITGMENKKEDIQQWTAQRVDQLKQLSQDPEIYQKLTDSVAPSIWELEDCKKGILCMLFGGNHVRVKAGSNDNNHSDERETTTKLNKRGDINILLCGDPGTSKSQLLSYVNKLSTRGIYTSGKGSSAVGLTASVVRDPETKDLVLESGALVLSDLGICCIDEFDKMSDTTRSVLHEAMEQQSVSIAKAGIIATLKSRTSILASANPKESRYNPNMSVVENIQLPPTLLSRFDLIYLILDCPDDDQDRRLAKHLVGLYYETPNVFEPPLDQALLRDYIEYARENIHPEISDEASKQLIDSYLEMRNPGGGASAIAANGSRTISATARQLESLIRLSEALAKMRYSSVVTRDDAREAVRLMKVATQTAATDPRTGRIDMDMITTGRSTAEREMEEQLRMNLKELLQERRGKRMAVREISKQLCEINNVSTVPHEDLANALRRLHSDGIIQFNERSQTVFIRTSLIR